MESFLWRLVKRKVKSIWNRYDCPLSNSRIERPEMQPTSQNLSLPLSHQINFDLPCATFFTNPWMLWRILYFLYGIDVDQSILRLWKALIRFRIQIPTSSMGAQDENGCHHVISSGIRTALHQGTLFGMILVKLISPAAQRPLRTSIFRC